MFKNKVNVMVLVVLCGILGEMTWTRAQQGKRVELTAADYTEIQQLYARYNFAIDANDAGKMPATFTEDGEFYNGTRVNGLGRDGITTFMRNRKLNTGRHWNTNLMITQMPDGVVKGAVYLLTVDVGKRPATVGGAAKYDDTLVKTPQGWRFKKRVVNNEGPPAEPAPAAKQ